MVPVDVFKEWVGAHISPLVGPTTNASDGVDAKETQDKVFTLFACVSPATEREGEGEGEEEREGEG